MTRPGDDISAEANIIRDELRHAVRRFDAAAAAAVAALDRAERFVRDHEGAHTGPVTVTTPAAGRLPNVSTPAADPAAAFRLRE